MPTTEQFSNLTESNGARNVRPKIQPESHFFIEGSELDFSQSVGQAFGPLSENIFRTSAKVTLSSTKNIYAICKGHVFVQPHTGDETKVNLILRPFNQPINEIGIKFFIYRGLKKSEFLNAVDGKVAAKPTTEFTTFVWDEFEKFFEDEESAPDFSDYFIGWPQSPEGQPETDLIEKYFNKITPILDPETGEEEVNFSYELPIIPRGIQLGTIDSGEEIGIDIVLNFGEYYIEGDTNPFLLDIAFGRMADGLIDLTGLPNEEPEDIYQLKLLREATTQFIDLAAFYGLHANGAGKIHLNDNADLPLTNASDIYNQISSFYTKNNVYCYIQTNRQRSYNFYGNYAHSEENTNNIKIGGTEETLTETTFGTMGWPVHIFSEAQDPETDSNTLCFQLTTDGHSEAALFLQTGFVVSEHENNFVRNTNLLETFSDDAEVEVDTGYTRFIKLETPSEGEFFIPNLIQAIYKGKQMYVEEFHDPPIVDPPKHLIKDVDELFGLTDAKSFKAINNIDEYPSLFDNKLKFSVFSIPNGLECFGVLKVKKIKDLIQSTNEETALNRVTYESFLNNIDLSSMDSKFSGILESSGSTNIFRQLEKNDFYRISHPHYTDNNLLVDETGTFLTGLTISIENSRSQPTKKVLGITYDEELALINLVSSLGLSNTTIGIEAFDEISLGKLSPTGIMYKTYKLFIIAESDDGKCYKYFQDVDIIVYTIDDLIYFSSDYTKFIPDTQNNDEDHSELIEIY